MSADQKSLPALLYALLALLVVAVAAAAVGLLNVGSSLGEQACIQRVSAQYPGVPVSAYNNAKVTGALKLSYDAERQQALKAC
jgi:hypothetical protein